MFTSVFPPAIRAACLSLTCLLGINPPSHLLRTHPVVPIRRWHHATVLATAYVIRPDPACETNTARTASGSRAQRGTIAVDTTLFAFGTHFRIPGYGLGVASDTGSAVIGAHIDLAMRTCAEALRWGPGAFASPTAEYNRIYVRKITNGDKSE